ncbi:uncharacterized protein LOC114251073 [Bombyx mandarina]|uniref:Uncharacterized protein LOC114251073 n=1 Tax=Bombyx mandarina TaxID=7092 RepID=A0A6J2KFF0_BOMMA|nr:uncharacterized protein LOC114251073 [Bombyx mandarina]
MAPGKGFAWICFCGVFILLLIVRQISASTKFNSHVSVSTPALTFTHGVGDPVFVYDRRPIQPPVGNSRGQILPARGNGYPYTKPIIPFSNEEVDRGSSINANRWQSNGYREVSIPILPPSPYKVDSPDPESLWPEGLFLPPIPPPRFTIGRRSDAESENFDPYLLEGSEAVAAVQRAKDHGHLYFHEIPHIQSLFENQELRVKNNLKPHIVGSIRHTWPFNRT